MNRKLRYGMIGGGRGAFIGAVHRVGAGMDGHAELVAGAFSSDSERSRLTGADLFVSARRAYGNYAEMAEKESRMPPEDRLDFVVIVTPNHEHFRPAKLFLERGFSVVCDKPVTFDLEEALALRRVVNESKKMFAVTHNYTGNAMVKQARALVRSGHLGVVRKVVVEYPQGWLSAPLERQHHKQAAWRTDPNRSGRGGCVGDIGTHAENLVHYITGLKIKDLCADLTSFVEGRQLDDDANVLIRFEGGAKGVLMASQICVGDENAFNIRVYGEKASLEWQQEAPNDLIVKYAGRPREIWRRGNDYLAPEAVRFSRVPPGHPEGYLESFGNIYGEVFRALGAEMEGRQLPVDLDYPTIDDGIRGMAFVEAVVDSSRQGAKWVRMPSG